jgi:hypothetical protein
MFFKTINMKNFAYWFRLVTKILIPVSFFIVAAFGSIWLAGVMTIVTLFYYVLLWQKVGETKE